MTPQPENPSHYDVPGTTVQLIDVIRAASFQGLMPQYEFFLWASAMQYMMRFTKKGTPYEDLKKCRVYLNWLIDCYRPTNGATYAYGPEDEAK